MTRRTVHDGTTLAPADRAMLDRRGFIGVCGCLAAGLAVTGCASVVARPVTVVDGRIAMLLADHPELARPNGVVAIHPRGMPDPLFVLRLADDRYAVLSPICTHRGCTVEAAGDRLECPCHGSAYDREGRVLKGPAERPLTRYAATVRGDILTIELPR